MSTLYQNHRIIYKSFSEIQMNETSNLRFGIFVNLKKDNFRSDDFKAEKKFESQQHHLFANHVYRLSFQIQWP